MIPFLLSVQKLYGPYDIYDLVKDDYLVLFQVFFVVFMFFLALAVYHAKRSNVVLHVFDQSIEQKQWATYRPEREQIELTQDGS